MQYLQGLSLLIAPIFIGRKLKVSLQLAAYLLVTALLLGSIFAWHIFPVAYVQGHGLTAFKIASEYIIVACSSWPPSASCCGNAGNSMRPCCAS